MPGLGSQHWQDEGDLAGQQRVEMSATIARLEMPVGLRRKEERVEHQDGIIEDGIGSDCVLLEGLQELLRTLGVSDFDLQGISRILVGGVARRRPLQI